MAEYDADLLLRSGVERRFEIVGEALPHAEDIDVDDELVWQITPVHVPWLTMHLETLLAE